MKCHSCPHHAAIADGRFFGKSFDELPCATCKLGEDTFFSVPFDEENPPDAAASLPTSHSQQSTSAMIPADVLSQFIQGLLSLPSELRDVVAWRYQGVPYKEIANRQGISIQSAEMRHKRAMRLWPVLKALFPEKTARRERRLAAK